MDFDLSELQSHKALWFVLKNFYFKGLSMNYLNRQISTAADTEACNSSYDQGKCQ